jgi:hypothetical protein
MYNYLTKFVLHTLFISHLALMPIHLINKPYVAIFSAAPQEVVKPLQGASFVPVAQLDTIVIPQAVVQPQISSGVSNCGDNSYANFIYSHESGCSTTALNPNGCYGLGQDCSGTVEALCGSNYTCQDQWFNNYALTRYGSWANAQAFWTANSWW